jgi:hypothetical protein
MNLTDKLLRIIQDPESRARGFDVSERAIRQLSREEAEEMGEFVLRELASKEGSEPWREYLRGDEEGGQSLLLHLGCLVPGLADRYWEYMWIDDWENDLYLQPCATLVPRAAGGTPGPVEAPAPHEGRCGWCGMQLICILSMDLTDPSLAFLELTGSRLRVLSCYRCVCYETIFSDVDLDGKSLWRGQRKPDFIGREGDTWDSTPDQLLRLGPSRRTPWEAHIRVTWKRLSQIGGYPNWIQDPGYPKCPGCSKRMLFIGQIENGVVWKGNEGVSHAFLCRECLIAAAGYQQS